MTHFHRHVFRAVIAFLGFVILVLLALRAFSGMGSVVAMVPLGHDRGFFVAVKYMGNCELTVVRHWPEPRWGLWAGQGWKDVGPFINWATFRDHQRHGYGYREGTAMVPLSTPGGPVEYERGYSRAVSLKYPAWLPGPPYTVVVSANQVQFPPGAAIVLISMIPLGLFLWKRRAVRRTILRRRAGLCGACGYDLRASTGACPECGETPLHLPEVRQPSVRFVRSSRLSLILGLLVFVVWVASFWLGVSFHRNRGTVVGDRLQYHTTSYTLAGGMIWRERSVGMTDLRFALRASSEDFARATSPQGTHEWRLWTGEKLNARTPNGWFGALYLTAPALWERNQFWAFVIGIRLYVPIILLAILPLLRWIALVPPPIAVNSLTPSASPQHLPPSRPAPRSASHAPPNY